MLNSNEENEVPAVYYLDYNGGITKKKIVLKIEYLYRPAFLNFKQGQLILAGGDRMGTTQRKV